MYALLAGVVVFGFHLDFYSVYAISHRNSDAKNKARINLIKQNITLRRRMTSHNNKTLEKTKGNIAMMFLPLNENTAAARLATAEEPEEKRIPSLNDSRRPTALSKTSDFRQRSSPFKESLLPCRYDACLCRNTITFSILSF